MIEDLPPPLSLPEASRSAERERFARLIHDGVMQGLAACVLATDLSQRYCRQGRIEDALVELAAIRDGLDLTVSALRDLLTEMQAPAADLPAA